MSTALQFGMCVPKRALVMNHLKKTTHICLHILVMVQNTFVLLLDYLHVSHFQRSHSFDPLFCSHPEKPTTVLVQFCHAQLQTYKLQGSDCCKGQESWIKTDKLGLEISDSYHSDFMSWVWLEQLHGYTSCIIRDQGLNTERCLSFTCLSATS